MKILAGVNLTICLFIASLLMPDGVRAIVSLSAVFSGVWLGALLAQSCTEESDNVRHDAVLLSAEILLLVLKFLFQQSG
jgi:hypothetical protein